MTHYSTFAILVLLFTYANSNMRKVFKCLDLHCGGEPGKIFDTKFSGSESNV